MTSTAVAPAKRHECATSNRYPHTEGDGAPKRKRCAYCGGGFHVFAGTWAAFDWRGDGMYRIDAAKRTFARLSSAKKFAGANGLVVRWLAA